MTQKHIQSRTIQMELIITSGLHNVVIDIH